MTEQSYSWDEAVKKEARGMNDDDLGEIQEVGARYVVTEKGLISKDRFYIPKYLVRGFDGETVWFNVTEEEAKSNFVREEAPTESGYYDKYKNGDLPKDIETRIPVIEEKLGVSKTQSTREARIKKEPVTKTERVQVPVEHEEVEIERRPASGETTADRPVESAEVRVPLKEEHVQVTKEPRVREEVVIKKRPVTETKEFEEEVRSERVDMNTKTKTK